MKIVVSKNEDALSRAVNFVLVNWLQAQGFKAP